MERASMGISESSAWVGPNRVGQLGKANPLKDFPLEHESFPDFEDEDEHEEEDGWIAGYNRFRMWPRLVSVPFINWRALPMR